MHCICISAAKEKRREEGQKGEEVCKGQNPNSDRWNLYRGNVQRTGNHTLNIFSMKIHQTQLNDMCHLRICALKKSK